MRFGRKQAGGPSDAEIKAALTLAARVDLPTFVKLLHKDVSGDYFLWEPWHDRLAEFFGRISRYEIPRATVRARPRSGKTEFGLMWMAFCIGRAPVSNWVLASYSADLAETNSGKLQRYLQSATFASVFPGVSIDQRSSSRARWLTTVAGELRAIGIEGGLTGYGAGRYRSDPSDRRFMGAIVFDDPIKIAEARSKVERDRVWQFYTETLAGRRNTPDTPIVITGQRAHADDLLGRLDASDEPWENLVIPWIDEAGQSFSGRFPPDEALLMRAAQPLVFATQYQQAPYLAEGVIFKIDQIPMLPIAPATNGAERVRAWDLAATEAKPGRDPDWTVGLRLARHTDGRLVIEDVVRLRGTPDAVRAAMTNTAARDGEEVRIRIEEQPGAAGKDQKQSLQRMLGCYSVEFVRATGPKDVRAEPAVSAVNVGNIACVQAPWTEALIAELAAFDQGPHDDQVDALAMAYTALLGGSATGWLEWMRLQVSDDALAPITIDEQHRS
jgi:predicted phage terminase large subunit-like protein